MNTQKRGTIAFAVCGSFCTLDAALAAAETLNRQGWELLPIMSFAAASMSGQRSAMALASSAGNLPSTQSARS